VHAAWFTVATAAILAGVAVVLALAGLTQPAAWMLAAPLAAASYALWNRGHERMVAEIYGDEYPFEFDSEDDCRERTDDWHRDWPPDDADTDDEEDEEWTWPGETGTHNVGSRSRDRARKRRRPSGGERERRRRGWTPDSGRRGRGGGGTTGSGGTTRTVDPEVAQARAVLGVEPDADAGTVRSAYRERVKEVHPDAGGSRETFKRVRWAYEVLADR
jgi:hypothetical protein